MDFDQLLFSELRLIAVTPDTAPLTEEHLVRAMTANEELLNIGYTLSPADIIALAKTEDAAELPARVRTYAGDVKAKPMYPDFPSQVMDIEPAVFRFHQLLHYLSTYGIEELTGMPVSKGWLPEMQDTEKTVPDKKLLEAKRLALTDSREKYLRPYRMILGKTERMTDKECKIIAECVRHLSPQEMTGVTVTFKQNLLLVFYALFADETLSSAEKLTALHTICQHTGDVWKCMDYALCRSHYHFRTAQKRLIVKLLESYPAADFCGNLILSNKKAARTLLMLKFIDFNEYSRNPACRQAVADLRAGNLRSWESGVKELVAKQAPEVLDVYAERPGMMLRHLTYLLRSGYRPEAIYEKLAARAADLNPQTLVRLIGFFSREGIETLSEEKYQEARLLGMLLRPLLTTRLAANETELRGKKIFVSMPEFNLDCSELRTTEKSLEGGYIRSGLAYRIPEGVRCIRFFIYWNDKKRVDVDLHAAAFARSGEQIHIGWNQNYKDGALVFSGDITHSDAAEYIDIDFDRAKETLRDVTVNINLYAGYETFSEIDECFVGAMAVSETGREIKLYDPKNCFFTHYLTGKYGRINYGYIDVQRRVIVFDGQEDNRLGYYNTAEHSSGFSLRSYLNLLFASQGAEEVSAPEEADMILVMGKPAGEKECSLIDRNFFLEG